MAGDRSDTAIDTTRSHLRLNVIAQHRRPVLHSAVKPAYSQDALTQHRLIQRVHVELVVGIDCMPLVEGAAWSF